jgi:hypothetical protein
LRFSWAKSLVDFKPGINLGSSDVIFPPAQGFHIPSRPRLMPLYDSGWAPLRQGRPKKSKNASNCRRLVPMLSARVAQQLFCGAAVARECIGELQTFSNAKPGFDPISLQTFSNVKRRFDPISLAGRPAESNAHGWMSQILCPECPGARANMPLYL